jgi:formate hydrogenlyase subunit 3/multisubunit Na+/H+ antiporter MnhD subunit
VAKQRWALWLSWSVFLALVALELAVPYVVPPRQDAWAPAQTAVAGFVLALFSLSAGVSTFALREALVSGDGQGGAPDRRSPVVSPRVRAMRLLALWALCLLIGFFGSVIAYRAATPAAAWPYVLVAGVLLVIHAPRHRLVASSGVEERGL